MVTNTLSESGLDKTREPVFSEKLHVCGTHRLAGIRSGQHLEKSGSVPSCASVSPSLKQGW